MYPKLSVITIVMNGMPYVEQTIDSVLNQSYRNSEYIVIDGGSIDGTVDVIKSRESGITKWVSEKDKGIADAFNKGLSFATGDYILFLNADDALVNSEILKVMAEEIVKDNFPDLIYGDCNLLDRHHGQILNRTRVIFSHQNLRRGGVMPHPSLFTHRRYFEKYGTFDPDFKIAMDYEWMLRGAFDVRISRVPILVTNVRSGGISTLNRSKAVNEIISALKKNKCITSVWGEIEMRAYFLLRALARKALASVGLYRLFVFLRNKIS